ncbi:MAG: YHS domain-containing (seleno)protein [Pseudomonadota bacterium]
MKHQIERRAFCALVAGAGLAAATGVARAAPGIFSEFGAAIRGADTVAFFTEGAAVEGSAQHSMRWRAANWLFASAANRARFAADPTAFAPQYDGWCAFAMVRGILAETDPTTWYIVDGKLYLNFSGRTRERFLRNLTDNIGRADARWAADYS